MVVQLLWIKYGCELKFAFSFIKRRIKFNTAVTRCFNQKAFHASAEMRGFYKHLKINGLNDI